jgi:ABC-type uncharacterized transport system
MATDKPQTSFSRSRKWKIGFDLLARTILVIAVVVMANYLGAQFSKRFYLSPQTSAKLSSRTVNVLQSLTNHVAVTLYYDRTDDFYPDIVALLDEYRALNPKISFTTVDYVREAGAAEKTKEKYGFSSAADKNLIIFDCDGRVRVANGDDLVKYAAKGISKDKKLEIGPAAFNAELMFTSILLALENPKPFKAYYLKNHGEPSLEDSGNFGYMKFATVLAQNIISVSNLELSQANDIPMDCDLLIIAAPTVPLSEMELQKIDQYLAQGGRLLVFLNYNSIAQPTGLEPILRRWGVEVAADYVSDPDTITGQDIKVVKFAHHPLIDPIGGNNLSLQMILPRPVVNLELKNPDAPEVTELAFSSDRSSLANNPTLAPRSYPLIAAVEQKNIAGVVSPRGTTRIVVAGDSVFLGNYYIEGGGNRDFLGYAVNWLLNRQTLLEGIGPRPLSEFRLSLSKIQRTEIQWLLLGALPGAVLLLGGLVWFVRRK